MTATTTRVPSRTLGPSAPRPLGPSRLSRRSATTLFALALLLLGTLVMVFPFYWMGVTSLATPAQAAESAAAKTFTWFPTQPQFENYTNALKKIGSRWPEGFKDALANSIVITALCVLGQVISCSLCGYAFARLRFRGREPAFVVMIATMMLPAQVTMIPLFLLFRSVGWVDTILPLVVPAFFGTPFFIFMFRQFFAQIPEALVEAARIDGCGHLGIWWRVMLPLCKPVIAITAVFTFIGTWNDFLGPLIYLQSEDQMTLAVALNSFQNQYGDFRDMNLLMAASIVTMIPCIVLFFVAQRQFVSGLSLGAVKG